MKDVLPRSPRSMSVFLILFLVFLSIFPVAPPVQAATAPNAIISIDNTSVALGGTTVVTVKVQGVQAPGLAGYDFKINYNSAAVNLVGLTGTSDFSVPISHFTAPDQNPSNVPGQILVIAAQSSGKTGDIQLFNLIFKAVGTSSQNIPITLTVNDGGFSDADLLDIPYTINNGSIALEGGSTPSLSVSPTMLTESSANDGSLASGDIFLTLANGTFATDLGKSDVNITGLPAGMDFTVSRTTGTELKVTLIGKALSHDNTNDTTLTLTVAKDKVSGASADITGTIGLDFMSNGVSNDATLTSTIGTVSSGGTANETITEVPSGTFLADFRAALTPATGATIQIYTTDGTTVAPDLADGYKVVVTAQNGTTKTTYTIHFAASQPTVSTAPTVAQISVLNNIIGTNDTVTVQGLHGGDIVNVYANSTTQTAIGTGTLPTDQAIGSEIVNIPQLGTTAGAIYVSITSLGMTESSRTMIHYAAEGQPNHDATLSNITLSAGVLSPAFDKNITTYNVSIPNESTEVPQISAVASDPQASVQITQASSTTGSALIVVTAGDQVATQTYEVKFAVSTASDGIEKYGLGDLLANTVQFNDILRRFYLDHLKLVIPTMYLQDVAITVNPGLASQMVIKTLDSVQTVSMSTTDGTLYEGQYKGGNIFNIDFTLPLGTEVVLNAYDKSGAKLYDMTLRIKNFHYVAPTSEHPDYMLSDLVSNPTTFNDILSKFSIGKLIILGEKHIFTVGVTQGTTIISVQGSNQVTSVVLYSGSNPYPLTFIGNGVFDGSIVGIPSGDVQIKAMDANGDILDTSYFKL